MTIAISFALRLRQRPATTTAWHLCAVIIRDAQLPAGLCADRFGGATTAVTGYTKNSSFRGRREQLVAACDEQAVEPHDRRRGEAGGKSIRARPPRTNSQPRTVTSTVRPEFAATLADARRLKCPIIVADVRKQKLPLCS